MSYFEARPTAVGSATARAIACKASRQRWHLRQSRHCRICNLQNVKRPGGFEPDPHWVAKTGPASRCTDEPVAEIVQCGEPIFSFTAIAEASWNERAVFVPFGRHDFGTAHAESSRPDQLFPKTLGILVLMGPQDCS